MNRFRPLLFAPLFALGLFVLSAHAQTSDLNLSLNRDWGFSDFSGHIQGLFTLRATGPDTLTQVEFFIDGQSMGVVSAAPWRLQFRTEDYPLGVHELTATGRTATGETLTSNTLTREFVPASSGWKTALYIAVPVLGLTILMPMVIYAIDRRRGGKRGLYGPWGGAICPNCGRPFALHVYALNVGGAKYDRCRHCGKWSRVHRAPTATLEAAEAAFAPVPPAEPTLSTEERLRRQLDASRFEDS